MEFNKQLLNYAVSLCYFTDERGPHFHILIPIRDSFIFIEVLITSQVAKHKEFCSKRKLECGLQISNKIKGFERLSKQSVINHHNQKEININDINSFKDFKVYSSDLDNETVRLLLKTICSSTSTIRRVKNEIQNKYYRLLNETK